MTIEVATASSGSAARAQILAFASPAGGSGQTSIVANAAWVLAVAGHRVLVLDWGNREPFGFDYLRPFLIGRGEAEQSLGAALAVLADDDPQVDRLGVDRFGLPGGAQVDMVVAGTTFTAAPTLPRAAGTGAQLRALLLECSYDYILLDCPHPVRDEALAQLAQLCDGIAVCFRAPSRVVQANAVEMVHKLSHQAQISLRLVAVPRTGLDRVRAEEQVERVRALMSPAPAPGDNPRVDPVVIEMPTHAYEAYGEVLPIILDDAAFGPALRAVVEALTGRAAGATELPHRTRERYERGFGIADPSVSDMIDVVYDPVDRRWLDWIAWQVQFAGAAATAQPSPGLHGQPAPGHQVLLLGDRALRQAGVRELSEHRGDTSVIRVLVEEEAAGAAGAHLPTIDLTGLDEQAAQARLLTYLGLVTPAQAPYIEMVTPRYPGSAGHTPPHESNAPPRNPLFNGRSAELDSLRDKLLSATGAAVLVGDAGVGKSEIAREYTARFADDYDLVWWIDAQTEESVNASLRPLSSRLRALRRDTERGSVRPPGFVDQVQGPLSTLAVLDDASFGRPFLLVFDNLDDLAVLDLVPQLDSGHVVITTRATDLPGVTGPLTVERLETADSIALLRTYAPQLTDEDAGLLAEAVDHLPLTLRMAGAWTRETMALLTRVAPMSARATASTVVRMLREQVAPVNGTIALSGISRTWKALSASLQESPDGRLASRLAELTAYLSPAVGLSLLRSGPMLRALSDISGADGDALATDAFTYDQVLWRGVLLGVFDISWGPNGVLRIHRALQQAVRDGLSDAERTDRRTRVQRALAEYAPTAAQDDDGEQQQHLAELQHHLGPCDAARSNDPQVRRWVIRQVRYMQLQQLAPVSTAALHIADTALAAWDADESDTLRGWLETERANILRWQGRYDAAREVDEQVRQRQRQTLGPDHLRTHITGRNLGGDLRAAGRYERAKAEDGAAYEGIRALLGEEHRHALMAAHNFALSSYLDGDVHTAMVTERNVLDLRLRLFGQSHPYTWWSAASLGTYQRELGRYRDSEQTLSRARDWINELLGPVPPDEMAVLRVDRSVAVTRRRNGRPHLAKDDDTNLIQAYARLLPSDHPDIWSCRLSLAADQHAMNESAPAVELARECLEYYLSDWPEGHPFIALCRLNLSVYLRGANQLDEAQEIGTVARKELKAVLSDGSHPWNLTADLNDARNLLAVGALRDASALAARVYALGCEDLPPGHPCVASAADTVTAVERALADLPHQGRERHLDIDIDIFDT